MKINVILTGATGMVGEGVLHECLQHKYVGRVLVIGRRTCGVRHEKLEEIIESDLYNLSAHRNLLSNFNACLFCLGTTSLGKKEQEYYKITYELTMSIAYSLKEANEKLVFCYISGAGTDSSEKGKIMWARVKGKTENDLISLFAKNAYNFRPGLIQPTKGLKNTLSLYKYLGWLLPLIRRFSPRSITTLRDLGLAMINTAATGYTKPVLEVSDIHLQAVEKQD